MLLCHQFPQGLQLLVLGGLPFAALPEHGHDDAVVLLDRRREGPLEELGRDPFHRTGRFRHKSVIRFLARFGVIVGIDGDLEQRLALGILHLFHAVTDLGPHAQRQVESVLDGVKVHCVPHSVAVEGHQKRDAARIHALVEAAATEAHHTLARAGQVVENLLFFGVRLFRGIRADVLLQSVPRQREIAHPVHHLIAVQPLEHVAGRGGELDSLRDAVREVVAGSVLHLQVLAPVVLVGQGIVLLDERAGAANEIQLHQVAPVVGIKALLERLDRSERDVAVLDGELLFPALGLDLLFGTNAEVKIWIDEKLQLVGEVEVILVVRSCRQQKDLVALIGQEILDHRIPLSFRIAQVVAFVDDDQLVEPFPAGVKLLGNRARLHLEVVLLCVLPPHLPQIRRTDHQRRRSKRFLVELRDRTGGNRLAQTDHIANHRTATLFQMAHRKLDRCLLEIKQLCIKRRRQMVLGNTLSRLTAEVIHDLQIHLVRRRTIHRRPTLVQNLNQVLGNVDGEVVIPPLGKPLGVLLVVMVVAELRVQFAIAHHTAEGQIARPHDRHNRIGRILRTMRQI